ADMVLRGLSGYNTWWALKVLPWAMEGAAGADPAAVTVFFGANDASLPDQVQVHQHVPLKEYQSNLRAICAYFKERWPSTAVILITPPPIYEPARIRGRTSQIMCFSHLGICKSNSGIWTYLQKVPMNSISL
ncbi:hypothetical protein ACJX0J_007601, partial [Zea mays]